MKKSLWLLAILALVLLASVTYVSLKKPETEEVVSPVVQDVKNIQYVVNGEVFTLINGKAELPVAPDSATKNTLTMFGEPVYGDLDGDGDADAAVLLVNEPGGSGTFYYASLAINTAGVYKTTETMLLGDRIAPQTIEIHEGRAVYNIAIRRGTDPMSTPPSIGQSIWVHYDAKTNSIGEWVKGFEGESATTTKR